MHVVGEGLNEDAVGEVHGIHPAAHKACDTCLWSQNTSQYTVATPTLPRTFASTDHLDQIMHLRQNMHFHAQKARHHMHQRLAAKRPAL